jgi:pimeloyl-ACP methyl ester carboxylesterase
MKYRFMFAQARSRPGSIRSWIARVVLIASILVLSWPALALAQNPPWPPPPICQEGQLGDQLTLICIPPGVPGDPLANWNGQLVVYAHGYVPLYSPLALPVEELGRLTPSEGPTVVDAVLSMGYAFATSSYSKNGYAVAEAEKDLNALVRHFKTKVLPNAGMLKKVLIVGASEGGLITTMLVEKYPGVYDGGLAMCGPLGGLPAHIQYLGDFRVVFDVFFPDVFNFGMADVPDDAWQNWPLYESGIPLAMQANPLGVQQLFSVTGAPNDPLDPTTLGITTLQVLYYSVWGTPDLIATAGGVPYDNQDTVYAGSLNDDALNAAVERIDSDGRARAYARRAYQPNGELERPLVTLHNKWDPAVPYWHEGIYAELAAPSGLFFQYPYPLENAYGHCNFTFEEVLGAFALLTTHVGP